MILDKIACGKCQAVLNGDESVKWIDSEEDQVLVHKICPDNVTVITELGELGL